MEGDIDGVGGNSPSAESPCEATKTFSALFPIPTSVKQGDLVKLRLGIPPAVLVRGEEVGHVQESDSDYVEACLLEGYKLSGSVQSIDPETGAGTVSVNGEKS